MRCALLNPRSEKYAVSPHPGTLHVAHLDHPGIAVIAKAAEQAGLPHRVVRANADSKANPAISEIDLLESSDVFVVVLAPGIHAEAHQDLRALAKTLSRPVVFVDSETKTVEIPTEQGWLSELFRIAALPPDANLETIKMRMSAVANRAAPLTRRHWKWILLLQALAALVPLVWLVRRSVAIPIEWVALLALTAVLVLIAVNWWLRWRGMQKTWARARLVAEVARSLLATAGAPAIAERKVFTLVPALQPMRRFAQSDGNARPFLQWRDNYLENRISDQEKYFTSKQDQAQRQRTQLSRWVTLLMDVALAFACAGAVFALAPDSRNWVRRFGDVRLEIVLGVAGAVMPLGVLLIQILREQQELDRRAARYAQQRQMLQQGRARLLATSDPEAVMKVVNETETALLTEVVNWYFNAETSEHFFSRGKQPSAACQPALREMDTAPARSLAARALGASGIAGLFLLRVILGRVPWIIASGVGAIAWIAYHMPGDAVEKAKLGPLATLHSIDGSAWVPDPAKTEHGCVIIVHGLHGHTLWTSKKEDWMQKCGDAIEQRINAEPPEICLHELGEGVATPADIYRLHLFESEAVKLSQDILAIREQAYQVGDQLGIRLALLVQAGAIRKDQPCHLIGHSAGGFVVTRAALTLTKLNLAPIATFCNDSRYTRAGRRSPCQSAPEMPH